MDSPSRRTSSRSIVVGTSLRSTSVGAIQQASRIAEALGAQLTIVHAPPCGQAPLVVSERNIELNVKRWVEARTSIRFGWSSEANPVARVVAALGEPADVLKRVAIDTSADLIVAENDPTTVARLLEWGKAAVLIASSSAPKGRSIVAGTDLCDYRLPVVRSAARLANSIAAKLTLVHSLDTPSPPRVDLVRRMRVLEQIANHLPAVTGARISNLGTSHEAILDAADTIQADLIVVGFRRSRGTTLNELRRQATSYPILALPLHRNNTDL